MGVSGRSMLEALIQGLASPEQMAELAQGRLRDKRQQLTQALEGRVQAHHRFVLTELLCQIDSLEETLARFDQAQHALLVIWGEFAQSIELAKKLHSQGRFLVLDADNADGLAALMQVAHQLESEAVPAYLETSRRGGHLWLFLDQTQSGG